MKSYYSEGQTRRERSGDTAWAIPPVWIDRPKACRTGRLPLLLRRARQASDARVFAFGGWIYRLNRDAAWARQ
jgi:hypothetical protein